MADDRNNFLLGPRGAKPKQSAYVEGLVYHATPTARVDKIKKEGIIPQSKGQWDDPRVLDDRSKHVHAFMNPRRALDHAERQAARTKEPQSVVAVKTPVEDDRPKDWSSDPQGHMYKLGSIRRKEPVKPSDIVDVHHVKFAFK